MGWGTPKRLILASSILVTLSFFYVFTLGSYVGITVYIFLNRVTYINPFDDYIINKPFDHIIVSCLALLWLILNIRDKKTRLLVCATYGALITIAILIDSTLLGDLSALLSLPAVIFFLLFYEFKALRFKEEPQKIIPTSRNLTVSYIALISTIVGLLSIIVYSVRIAFVTSLPVYNYTYAIFLIFSSFSPLFLLTLAFCFPVKLLTDRFLTRVLKVNKKWVSEQIHRNEREKRTGRTWFPNLVYLSLIVLLSFGLSFIPHLPSVNENNELIGSDSSFYVPWMDSLMQSTNAYEFFQDVNEVKGDRPITLAILIVFIKILNVAPILVLEHLPLILGPLLVLVVYFLVREMTLNETTALIAALPYRCFLSVY